MDEEFNNKVGAVQHNEDHGLCVGLLITKVWGWVSSVWKGYEQGLARTDSRRHSVASTKKIAKK